MKNFVPVLSESMMHELLGVPGFKILRSTQSKFAKGSLSLLQCNKRKEEAEKSNWPLADLRR